MSEASSPISEPWISCGYAFFDDPEACRCWICVEPEEGPDGEEPERVECEDCNAWADAMEDE
jgi:hypothetical protein